MSRIRSATWWSGAPKRLEVKQSAARQPWSVDEEAPARFDIAPREGYWKGNQWVAAPGRYADLFIFARHPIFDPKECDQREVRQWQFYVLPTCALPPGQQTIGLATVKEKGGTEVLWDKLSDEVMGLL